MAATLTQTRIRPATLADLDQIVAMGLKFLTSPLYRDVVTPSPATMTRTATFLIDAPDGLLEVAEVDGALVGMFGLYVVDHMMSGERVASEMFWWVEPEARGSIGLRLLRQAETWAKAHGATSIQMIAPDARVEQLYTRLGYVPVERLYQRRLA